MNDNGEQKLISLEEWLGMFDALLDCRDDEAEEMFNAARRGLAGPPELMWEQDIDGDWIAQSDFGDYDVIPYQISIMWGFVSSSSKNKRTTANKCNSIEDGKRQAQAHFERLWWSMSRKS